MEEGRRGEGSGGAKQHETGMEKKRRGEEGKEERGGMKRREEAKILEQGVGGMLVVENLHSWHEAGRRVNKTFDPLQNVMFPVRVSEP